jgi:hypothetical protein
LLGAGEAVIGDCAGALNLASGPSTNRTFGPGVIESRDERLEPDWSVPVVLWEIGGPGSEDACGRARRDAWPESSSVALSAGKILTVLGLESTPKPRSAFACVAASFPIVSSARRWASTACHDVRGRPRRTIAPPSRKDLPISRALLCRTADTKGTLRLFGHRRVTTL